MMKTSAASAKRIRTGAGARKSLGVRFVDAVKRDWQLYILLLPAMFFVFLFCYLPLYGIQIAFRDYKAVLGITGSEWVGLKNFTDFFSAYYFQRLITNTFLLNLYNLLWSFPIPIIMAILLNQFTRPRVKKITQTVIYIPVELQYILDREEKKEQ